MLASSLPKLSLDLVRIVCSYIVCANPTKDAKPKFLLDFASAQEHERLAGMVRGLAVDALGRIWTADDGRVCIYDCDGKWLKTAAPDRTLSNCCGIACDSNGEVFISAFYDVEVCDLDGKYLRMNEIPGNEHAELGTIDGIAVNGHGLVFLAMHRQREVRVFTRIGNFVRSIGCRGSGPGQLENPRGVAVSVSSGEVFVSDFSLGNVQVRVCVFAGSLAAHVVHAGV